jgi:hypothetical protein
MNRNEQIIAVSGGVLSFLMLVCLPSSIFSDI